MNKKPDQQLGIYLYCLGLAEKLTTIKGNGLNDKYPLFLESKGNIAGVVSHVIMDDFTGPKAEENLKDIKWIGPLAYKHQEIVESVMADAIGLPTRFGTIFSSKESLFSFFQTHEKTISKFLKKVQDHEEWSIKGFMDRKKTEKEMVDKEIAKEENRLSKLTPGVRYFQEKKIKTQVSKQFNVLIQSMIDDIAQDLDAQASDFCQLKILSKDATGKQIDMIFNWAYLIHKTDITAFHEKIREINIKYEQKGLSLDHSGPWPPYSFCPTFEEQSI